MPDAEKLKFFWENCVQEKIDSSSIIEKTQRKMRKDAMKRRKKYFLVASASIAASFLICISTIYFLNQNGSVNLDFQAIAEEMDSQSVEEVTLITSKEQLNLDEDVIVYLGDIAVYHAGRTDTGHTTRSQTDTFHATAESYFTDSLADKQLI